MPLGIASGNRQKVRLQALWLWLLTNRNVLIVAQTGFQLLNYQTAQLPNVSRSHLLRYAAIRRPHTREVGRLWVPRPSRRNSARSPQGPRPRARRLARETISPKIEPSHHPA